MPSLLTIGILFAVLVLVSLAVQAGSLWLMCRLVRLKEVTFRRALLAIIVAAIGGALVSYAFDFLFTKLADDEPMLTLVGHAASFLISLAVSLLIIPGVLRVPFLRGFLAALGEFALRMVYVVVFVLVVRATMVEGFMIPTGGMAPTILGYHKRVPCPHCGFAFEVNASMEAEGIPEHRRRVSNCVCPNCRTEVDITSLVPVPQV